MIDIKTRPQMREIKIRDAATIAPRELPRLLWERTNAKLLRGNPEADNSTPEHDTLQGVEAHMQNGAAYVARKTYNGGKRLAQGQLKKRSTAKQADFPGRDSQPVSIHSEHKAPLATHARQEFWRKNAPAQGVKTRRDFAAKKPYGKTAEKVKHTYKQRAQAQAVGKMQQRMAQKAAKQTVKNVSQLAQAIARTGRAIVHAAVGLLGGAGALIALVLVVGGAAAIIATPFGVFWSGQDEETQSVSMAVAQINAEFIDEINRIQAENAVDSTIINHIPGGGSDLAITNWKDGLSSQVRQSV